MVSCERSESKVQRAFQDMHRENSAWRAEVEEKLRHFHKVYAQGEKRFQDLEGTVGKLARDVAFDGEEMKSVMMLPSTAIATGTKVTELSVVVEQLARDMSHSFERADSSTTRVLEDVSHRFAEFQHVCNVRIEAATRAAEQLRVTEGAQRNELWREVRDIRSQLADFRARCGGASAMSRGPGAVSNLPTGFST